MAGVDVGGDESVQWLVEVDNVRQSKLKQEPRGPKGWKHEGVDETNHNERFTVLIRVPQDADEFIRTFTQAAAEAQQHSGNPGFTVSFRLPIEQGNHDQIRIRWNSAP